jgi:predicted transcriptional regulator
VPERLRDLAERLYRSESDLIRDAIREYLDRHD